MRPLVAFCGDSLVEARGREVAVRRIVGGTVHEVSRFRVDEPAARLVVAPDGAAVIGHDIMHERAWLWRPTVGVQRWATSSSPREGFAFGFVRCGGELLLLTGGGGALRGHALAGDLRFVADARAPHAFSGHTFVELGRDRLGVVGRVFGDSSDTVVTVALDALRTDPQALQRALDDGAPLLDRAPYLSLGRFNEDALVFRDPEDDEPPETDEPEDLPDVWGFRGFYLRDLDSGALGDRVTYQGPVRSGAPIVATGERIAVQGPRGIDVVDRRTGDVDHLGDRGVTALDPLGARIASLDESGAWTIRALDG